MNSKAENGAELTASVVKVPKLGDSRTRQAAVIDRLKVTFPSLATALRKPCDEFHRLRVGRSVRSAQTHDVVVDTSSHNDYQALGQ